MRTPIIEFVESIRADLAETDRKRAALVETLQASERLLAVTDATITVPRTVFHGAQLEPEESEPLPADAEPNEDTEPRLTQREAVEKVVKDARGRPLSAKEILERVKALGVNIGGKQPEGIVDLLIRDLTQKRGQPIERVKPLVWRWAS